MILKIKIWFWQNEAKFSNVFKSEDFQNAIFQARQAKDTRDHVPPLVAGIAVSSVATLSDARDTLRSKMRRRSPRRASVFPTKAWAVVRVGDVRSSSCWRSTANHCTNSCKSESPAYEADAILVWYLRWRCTIGIASLRGASQLEPSFGCSDGALAAGHSVGSLKYKHHFGLECFSMRREHWALQASLTHSSNDDSFAASGLDAAAFAVRAFGRTGFVGGKICSVGVTSATGFSRSKHPVSAHPARARARSVANTHFIFAPNMQCPRHIRCIMRQLQARRDES